MVRLEHDYSEDTVALAKVEDYVFEQAIAKVRREPLAAVPCCRSAKRLGITLKFPLDDVLKLSSKEFPLSNAILTPSMMKAHELQSFKSLVMEEVDCTSNYC
jgi:hypothetical protein